MQKVQGIGGVFIRAKDRHALSAWYRKHLGIDIDDEWCGAILPGGEKPTSAEGGGIWSAFDEKTDYFGASENQFMVNFRVADRDAMLAQLREGGCDVDEKTEENDFGHFGWVTDPEGHRVELWQPPTDRSTS
jgi:predicted enzyme related to lactoylglutathione lyase